MIDDIASGPTYCRLLILDNNHCAFNGLFCIDVQNCAPEGLFVKIAARAGANSMIKT